MASPLYDKRQVARPAAAGRFRVLSPAIAFTAVVALLACLLALQTGRGGGHTQTPRFLSTLLGPERAGALPARRTGPRSTTAVRGGGYTVGAAGASVSLASAEAATAPWTAHDNGAARPTRSG